MPMREECKHYESRTYPNGETVRKCDLDLAPEAPWRCPENCSAFAPRLADVSWAHGSIIAPPTPPEPPGLDDGAAELLDEAEDIINAAGPRIMAELGVERDREKAPWWKRLRRNEPDPARRRPAAPSSELGAADDPDQAPVESGDDR